MSRREDIQHIKVLVMGAPGSGKTTLARSLCGMKGRGSHPTNPSIDFFTDAIPTKREEAPSQRKSRSLFDIFSSTPTTTPNLPAQEEDLPAHFFQFWDLPSAELYGYQLNIITSAPSIFLFLIDSSRVTQSLQFLQKALGSKREWFTGDKKILFVLTKSDLPADQKESLTTFEINVLIEKFILRTGISSDHLVNDHFLIEASAHESSNLREIKSGIETVYEMHFEAQKTLETQSEPPPTITPGAAAPDRSHRRSV